ncbi:MAG: DUF1844 domain-containing protein [Pirellulaceae bacterium]|nr:DUF1844 domain-containing protein [Planctomycetales bacterium]
MSSNQPERKIIIDEDWKSQVEAEREQFRQQDQNPTASAEPTGAAHASGSAPDEHLSGPEQLPPASFPMLVTGLATQAVMAFGEMQQHPDQAQAHLQYAKYTIDTLAVLEVKTRGNLTADEAAMLDNALHELRMQFVHFRDAAATINP